MIEKLNRLTATADQIYKTNKLLSEYSGLTEIKYQFKSVQLTVSRILRKIVRSNDFN